MNTFAHLTVRFTPFETTQLEQLLGCFQNHDSLSGERQRVLGMFGNHGNVQLTLAQVRTAREAADHLHGWYLAEAELCERLGHDPHHPANLAPRWRQIARGLDEVSKMLEEAEGRLHEAADMMADLVRSQSHG